MRHWIHLRNIRLLLRCDAGGAINLDLMEYAFNSYMHAMSAKHRINRGASTHMLQ